jgi:hypothetical protein
MVRTHWGTLIALAMSEGHDLALFIGCPLYQIDH